MTTSKFGFPLFVLACALVCTLAFRGNATAGDTETLGWNFAEGSHPQPYTHISQQEAATLVAQDFEEGDSAPSAAGEKSARNEHDVWLDRVRKNSDIVRGKASWYGRDFDARPTASGLPYDMYTFTAAHRTLPIGTVVRVSDQYNGKSVMTVINGRNVAAELDVKRYAEIIGNAEKAVDVTTGRNVVISHNVKLSPRQTMVLEF